MRAVMMVCFAASNVGEFFFGGHRHEAVEWDGRGVRRSVMR
jgi:hypothetical protein